MAVVDFFVNGALGVIGPFFAIFITQQIKGGDAAVVGFATASYWVVKSVFQLPIARFLDKTDGKSDEFWAFFCGYIATALVPILYYLSSAPWHLYLVQAGFGFAMAWAVPAWYSIFTTHLDAHKIAFEWSLVSVISVGASASIAAALGGLLIKNYGFNMIFIIASLVIFLSALAVLSIKDGIVTKKAILDKNTAGLPIK